MGGCRLAPRGGHLGINQAIAILPKPAPTPPSGKLLAFRPLF
ncbi:hypothetical protein SPLC1_S410710 [Arthrospira platensis C1]|uniref:Uncharacterized protein n=2 Tax=Limnospira TaxID=2596745 RepID=A0A9P1NZK1_9CYAN|nr:hypothetical protein AmaxDRAFT_5270 [Limnospira maxima CS-328]EKD07404.1 hypothetical protein SPLC1_S410710 [Arthrospira platensis C1]CDM96353.1 conserved protein of unknown function [Limnospira indica PCC 8005]